MFHFLLLWFNNLTLRDSIEFRPFPLVSKLLFYCILGRVIFYPYFRLFQTETQARNISLKLNYLSIDHEMERRDDPFSLLGLFGLHRVRGTIQ